MTDAWSRFREAMDAAGLRTPDALSPTDKIQRFYIDGDRKGTKNGWYVFYADAPESGAFGSYKLGINDTWTVERPERLNDAQRAELRQRMERLRQERAATLAREHEMARAAAAAIVAACEKADPSHLYLVAKGISGAPGVRQLARDVKYQVLDDERPQRVARKGSLVIPIKGPDGALHSVQTISPDGKKHFLKGTNKAGHYFSIGKLTQRIIICEGFSTSATVHLATGCCVVIAFDAGNLEAVARAIKAKYPDHEIVIGADNDRLTLKPVPNPGMTMACEAAIAAGGKVAWPEFEREAVLKNGGTPTDFNDLAEIRSLEAVLACFEAAMYPEDIADHADPRRSDADAPPPYQEELTRQPDPEPEPEPEEDDRSQSRSVVKHLCIGFEGTTYYFKSDHNGVIHSASGGELGKNKLLQLADLRFWETHFPGKNGADWTAATNAVICECSRYDYDPMAITGRGVHLDKDRVVLHLGGKLIIDGKPNSPRNSLEVADSERVYERRQRIKLKPCKPLDAEGGRKLVECLDLLPWTSSDMACVMAGWLVIAPICGMLFWRPHLWLVGPRGSGKSWVMHHVAARILGKLALQIKGSTTEAGIRQILERDALPVIFDEAESQNDESRRRLQLIIDMARHSSSEDTSDIIKGGQNGKAHRFRIQSTFLFGSINLGADQAADLSRIITLALEGPNPYVTPEEKKARSVRFDMVKKRFDELMLGDFGPRLFARTVLLAKIIRANAEMLATVIAESADSRRASDTVAMPMAGWYSLTHDDLLTRDAARRLVEENNWAMDVAERTETEADHERAVAHLLDQKIRITQSREESVASAIWACSASAPGNRDRCEDEHAYRALLNIGIRVLPGDTSRGYAHVWLAQSHSELGRLFERTPWASSWAPCLAQHPGCTKTGPKAFGNARKRAMVFNMLDLGITGES